MPPAFTRKYTPLHIYGVWEINKTIPKTSSINFIQAMYQTTFYKTIFTFHIFTCFVWLMTHGSRIQRKMLTNHFEAIKIEL